MQINYMDFHRDEAYIVTKGNDTNFITGDIVWVDSCKESLMNATQGGWLDKEEITDDIFDGADFELSDQYKIITKSSGATCAIPISDLV